MPYVASETLTVTDHSGHRQTLLPVREINLKACTPIILKQFIQPTWGLNPGPADNRFRLSALCANEPQRRGTQIPFSSDSLRYYHSRQHSLAHNR